MAQVCSPNTGETDTGRSLELADQLLYSISKHWFIEASVYKIKQKRIKGGTQHLPSSDLHMAYACTHTNTDKGIHYTHNMCVVYNTQEKVETSDSSPRASYRSTAVSVEWPQCDTPVILKVQ